MSRKRLSALGGIGFVTALTITACGGGGSSDADAGVDDYPNAAITWLVGYAPGGGGDTSSRVIAACMEEGLGQSIRIENMEGASGARATQELVNAKPDGYTVAYLPETGVALTPLLNNLPFGVDDVTAVGAYRINPHVILASPNAPFDTAEEMFDYIEQNPGGVRIGLSSGGGPKRVASDAIEADDRLEVNVVPFNTTPELVSALLGDNVEVGFGDGDEQAVGMVEAGELKALGTLSDGGWPAFPDLPSISELGYENATIPAGLWTLSVPAETPDDIVTRLEAELEPCLEDETVIQTLGELNIPEPFMGSEETMEYFREAAELYAERVGNDSN